MVTYTWKCLEANTCIEEGSCKPGLQKSVNIHSPKVTSNFLIWTTREQKANLCHSQERDTLQYPFHRGPWRIMDAGVSPRKPGAAREPTQGAHCTVQRDAEIAIDMELLCFPLIPSLTESYHCCCPDST